jgi:hypothetical protein
VVRHVPRGVQECAHDVRVVLVRAALPHREQEGRVGRHPPLQHGTRRHPGRIEPLRIEAVPHHTNLVRMVGIQPRDGIRRGLGDRHDHPRPADRVGEVRPIPQMHREPRRQKARRQMRRLHPHHVVHRDHERTGQARGNHVRGGVVQVVALQTHHRAGTQQRGDGLRLTGHDLDLANAVAGHQRLRAPGMAKHGEREPIVESDHVPQQGSRVVADAAGLRNHGASVENDADHGASPEGLRIAVMGQPVRVACARRNRQRGCPRGEAPANPDRAQACRELHAKARDNASSAKPDTTVTVPHCSGV